MFIGALIITLRKQRVPQPNGRLPAGDLVNRSSTQAEVARGTDGR